MFYVPWCTYVQMIHSGTVTIQYNNVKPKTNKKYMYMYQQLHGLVPAVPSK